MKINHSSKYFLESFKGQPLLAILVGLVLFGFGASLTVRQFQMRQDGQQAMGQVIRNAENRDDKGCRYRSVV